VADRRDRVDGGGHVAGAAALGDEPPAGLQRRVQPREQAVVVGDPVERRGREDRVDGAVELELGEIGGEDLRAAAEPFTGLLDHRLRAVDGDDLAARQALDERRGHAAGPAAGVEHALVAAQVEPVQHVAPHRLLGRGDALIGGCVPLSRRHTSVRYRIRSTTTTSARTRSPGGAPVLTEPPVIFATSCANAS